MATKTFTQFQKELDSILLAVQKGFLRLGEVLFEARAILSHNDFTRLQSYIVKQGPKKTDQRACVAAFLFKHPDKGEEDENRVDPRLIYAGATNSKILSMDREDQDRLLSEEKFAVLQPSRRVLKKTWAQMTDHERNMLIGKGGKIKHLGEQEDSLRHKANLRWLHGGNVEVTSRNLRVSARDNSTTISYDIENFLRKVGDEGWEFMNRARKELQQERPSKVKFAKEELVSA